MAGENEFAMRDGELIMWHANNDGWNVGRIQMTPDGFPLRWRGNVVARSYYTGELVAVREYTRKEEVHPE